MPFETGGRADKLGNAYENSWLVCQYNNLLREKIDAVMYEAIGDDEEGVDIWVTTLDNRRLCYQCKARNGSESHWRLSDLHARDVLKNAKKQLDRDPSVMFRLVSAVPELLLRDLRIMALNSELSGVEFFKKTVSSCGKKTRDAFSYFCSCMDVDLTSDVDLVRAKDYLLRFECIHFSDDTNQKEDLLASINQVLLGKSEVIFALLETYAVKNNRLGQSIIARDLLSFLNANGVFPRLSHEPGRILPVIAEINNKFNDVFVPIQNSLFNRKEFNVCIDEIKKGQSIIVHGAAGSGKSGCIQGIISYVERENIPYIAVKLDKYVPEYNANRFGEMLGLPYSPVMVLDDIAREGPACLILDQLDAIRWTTSMSASALDVCKEILRQVERVNLGRDKKISVVFACRTFDMENDSGIKSLLDPNGRNPQKWHRVKIGLLDDSDVVRIVGSVYDGLHAKTRELLRVPANLYIWEKLSKTARQLPLRTASSMLNAWWEQILQESNRQAIDPSVITNLVGMIVEKMQITGRLSLPKSLFDSFAPIIRDYLVSVGLLYTDNINLAFSHQSFFDYFLVKQSFERIVLNESTVLSEIPSFDKQSPATRFRLQLVLDRLLEYDPQLFFSQGILLLNCTEVRFYYKYVFLEVLSTLSGEKDLISRATDELFCLPEWKMHFLDVAVLGHPEFVMYLAEQKILDSWFDDPNDIERAIVTLQTVSHKIPDYVTVILKEKYNSGIMTAAQIMRVLHYNMNDDSDSMFEFRLAVLRENPKLIRGHTYIEDLLSIHPKRALRLLAAFLPLTVSDDENDFEVVVAKKESDACQELAATLHDEIPSTLLPIINRITDDYTPHLYVNRRNWHAVPDESNSIQRFCVKLVIAAMKLIANINTALAYTVFAPYYTNKSILVKEIFLAAFEGFPDISADYIIEYLLSDLQHNIWDYTSSEKHSLALTQNLLMRLSPVCNDNLFLKLECALVNYRTDNELEVAKDRFEHNRNVRKGEKGYENSVQWYWPYWGKVQKMLLPCLSPSRISGKTRDLIAVLNRNKMILADSYKRSHMQSGWVKSVIDGKTDLIGDKQWLKILKNLPNKEDPRRDIWKESEGGFYTSSPDDFCSTMRSSGAKNPKRFALLALRFPDSITDMFVSAALSWIQYTAKDVDSDSVVDVALAEQLFVEFESRFSSPGIARSFCDTLEKRKTEMWSAHTLSLLSEIAINNDDPKPGKYKFYPKSKKKDDDEPIDLLTESINCTRGEAAHCISKLLWENPEWYPYLKDAVDHLISDSHLAVRTAAFYCISAVYNIDREYARTKFIQAIRNNPHILILPGAWELLYRVYQKSEQYQAIIVAELTKLFTSGIKKHEQYSATHLTALYLFQGLECFSKTLDSPATLTKGQVEGITIQLIGCYEEAQYKLLCKKHLMQILNESSYVDEVSFSRLFSGGRLTFPEDNDIVKVLLTHKTGNECMHTFLEYVSNHDIDIRDFKDILMEVCIDIRPDSSVPYDWSFRVDNLASAIIILMDRAPDDDEVFIACLDMWDILFTKAVGHARSITKALNEA